MTDDSARPRADLPRTLMAGILAHPPIHGSDNVSTKPTRPVVTGWRKLNLWPHQIEAVEKVRRYQSSGSTGSALVRMPPGSGKTGIMAVLSQAFSDTENVLVVAPWAQLTYQISQEIGERFWDKLGAQPVSELKPAIPFRPSHLPDLLKKQGKKQTVFVCTNQTLERLLATDAVGYQALANRINLVLVDEGHREPAPEWSRAIRELKKPTILFTATPYRNDRRDFNVDDKFVFRFTYGQALGGRFVRRVTFRATAFESTPAAFVDSLLSFYQSFKRRKPAGGTALRVIVRCATDADVDQIARLLEQRNQTVVAVHENFDPVPSSQRFRRVPDPTQNDAIFWVHQFKLIEGIDDPDFALLAIYQPLATARAVVQQVGRIIRNPQLVAGSVAEVFCHPQHKQQRMWDAYLRYEDKLGKGATEVGSPEMVRELLSVQDRYAYLDGTFRAPFDPTRADFYEHLRYPLSANIFVTRKDFKRERLLKSLEDMLEEEDSAVLARANPSNKTDVVVYARSLPSPVLSDQMFLNVSLGFVVMRETDHYLFYYDSDGQTPDYLYQAATRVEADELERALSGDNVRMSQISLLNSDLGVYSVRRRSLTATSLEQVAPTLGDQAHFCSTAIGTVEDPDQGRQRRYVGFTRSRISDQSSNPVDFDEFVQWTDRIDTLLQDSSATVAPLFERYAINVRAPAQASAAHILLDLADIEEEIDLIDDATGLPSAAAILVEESSSEVKNGMFSVTIGGRKCGGAIVFDARKRRFDIESKDMNAFRIPYGPQDNRKRFLVGHLNVRQAFRVITADGLVYAHGRFNKPRFPLWGRKKNSRIDILDVVVSTPSLEGITSEKGTAIVGAGAGWQPGSLFEFIDRRTASGLLRSQQFNADVLICDDLGPELADFIALQFDPPRIALIHAKHAADNSSLSTSAFHVICSQATKNLGILTPYWENLPKHVGSWNGGWSAGFGRVASRIRINTPGKTASDLLLEIQRIVRQPATSREVWIVMGNGLSVAALQEARGKVNPPANAVQLIYLLQSTWAAVSAVGGRLRIFCKP